MNKRIKQKVAKRIITKIGTEQLLTDFERKYFIKFFWKPLKNEVTSIIEVLKIEEELVKEKIEELSVEKETSVEQSEWSGGIDLAEGPDMTVQSVVEIDEQIQKPEVRETTIGGLTYSSTSFPTEKQLRNAVKSMNSFGSRLNPKPSVASVEEPSKWNKLKGKVKGWFGR